MSTVKLRDLDVATYVPHEIHRRERVWAESNCYVDLWVELLNGLGRDPVPCLAFTVGLDFEGDQLTFFKFPIADLRRMYGIDIIELNVWRGLDFHVADQLSRGRAPIIEVDSWYLPDTAGVSYQIEHTKTSIAVNDIDLDGRRMGYFHGQSYFVVEGEDFDRLMRRVPPYSDAERLPPYFEVAKLDHMEAPDLATQHARAVLQLREQVARRPRENPLTKLGARFAEDLDWMKSKSSTAYHGWAFATLRQAGASFELLALFLRWLSARGEPGLDEAIAGADQVAESTRTLMLKVARAVNGKRAIDATETLATMAAGWDTVMRVLDTRYGLAMSTGGGSVVPGPWQLAELPPGAAKTPSEVPSNVEWVDALVPGTLAASLGRAGRWSLDRPRDLDAVDVWYRTGFAAEKGGVATLSFDGLASIAEVFVNGEKVLSASNALRRHHVTVRNLEDDNALVVRFLSLTEALRARKPRPRWKTRLVSQQQLRWHRTPLLGRIAGWTPPVTPVGPYRAVSVTRGEATPAVRLRTSVSGSEGIVIVSVEPGSVRAGSVTIDDRRAELDASTGEARLSIPDVRSWWPHTHGEQPLYDVAIALETSGGEQVTIHRRTGFRTLDARTDDGGFSIAVNGVPVFCRGACWMPTDAIGLSSSGDRLALEQMRDAGMNIVRCTGTMPYEDDAFFAACDELGLLVWQDFGFANLDYPAEDASFAAEVELEARDLATRTAHCPSMAIFCGGSEVEQQAAMVGMAPDAWSNRLFDSVLPDAVAALSSGAIYVRNSPTGGPLPFTVDRGVAHYYGVGAYLRPLEDARHSGVRFTSECLGFSNVPAQRTCDLVLGDYAAPQHPAWKARAPRDGGVGWDFEDVRDHYLALLYRVDPAKLRYADWERYLALSREVTGDVMARTMREFRRGASPCQGAIVWFFRDLWPGAGWGVVDALARPKAAWFHLKRAQAKVALSLSDEGLNGLRLHAWNDHEQPLSAKARVALYQDGETETVMRETDVIVPARGESVIDVDRLFGSFTDATYAYRFGPPAHDLATATLIADDGTILADACHFPHGPPIERSSELGLVARGGTDEHGAFVEISTHRLAWAVALDVEGLSPEDDHVTIGPGQTRRIRLRGSAAAVRGTVTALNGRAPTRITSA